MRSLNSKDRTCTYVSQTRCQAHLGKCVVRLILLVGSLVALLLVTLLLVRVVCLPPGHCVLVFTNATDRVVSEANIEIRHSKQVIYNLAPQAATTLVFKASSDTSYTVNVSLGGQESVHTNVGYLCRGIDNRDMIVVHGNSTLSFWRSGLLVDQTGHASGTLKVDGL